MSALGGLFEEEMGRIVSTKAIRRCLSGIKTVPKTGALMLRDVLITTACTIVAAVTISGYVFDASTPQAASPAPIDVPQHLSTPAPAAVWDEDTATDEGAAISAASVPALIPSGAGTEVPNTSPAPFAPVATRVQGKLYVKNTSISDGITFFSGRYYAAISQNQRTLAKTTVQPDGVFDFSDLSIADAGSYTLQIYSDIGQGLEFSEENKDGTVSIYLTPGEALVINRPIYMVDEQAPVIAISLFDSVGQKTAINPKLIEIEGLDATMFSVSWMLYAAADPNALEAGEAAKIDGGVLEKLQEGLYILKVTATDIANNTATLEKSFYIQE